MMSFCDTLWNDELCIWLVKSIYRNVITSSNEFSFQVENKRVVFIKTNKAKWLKCSSWKNWFTWILWSWYIFDLFETKHGSQLFCMQQKRKFHTKAYVHIFNPHYCCVFWLHDNILKSERSKCKSSPFGYFA